jgi:hypothetical protein
MKVQDNNSVQDQSGNSHNHMLLAVVVDNCVEVTSVITEDILKKQGWFIPSDIKKLHITFKNPKR